MDCAGDLNGHNAPGDVYVSVDNRNSVYIKEYTNENPSRPHDFLVVASQFQSLKMKLWQVTAQSDEVKAHCGTITYSVTPDNGHINYGELDTKEV